ncbi:hypothetical protein XH80_09005 [Bradyrhizobium sp. CCBAU 45384]|nr:hypothetical protein [Bradyrhizobium sp. CCBAU 45384]
MGQCVAVHHGPELANVWRDARAKRGTEISQGVDLAIFRLAQSTGDLREVISVSQTNSNQKSPQCKAAHW